MPVRDALDRELIDTIMYFIGQSALHQNSTRERRLISNPRSSAAALSRAFDCVMLHRGPLPPLDTHPALSSASRLLRSGRVRRFWKHTTHSEEEARRNSPLRTRMGLPGQLSERKWAGQFLRGSIFSRARARRARTARIRLLHALQSGMGPCRHPKSSRRRLSSASRLLRTL
ncbi:MAG: hypothetical protein JWM59_3795 [Verrucomicrobiales bacterium]|nr:hypothetical protein [Verrucomicrobiales bacterium]